MGSEECSSENRTPNSNEMKDENKGELLKGNIK
jgi:hypothetical protein